MNKLIILAIMLSAAAVNGACPNDEYCASCNGTVCTICVNSYLNNGVCVEPATKIDNCYNYSSASACLTCNSGYYLSGNQCLDIGIDNCVERSTTVTTANAACIACDNGKLPVNGTCTGDVDCNIDNCAICKYANNSTGAATTTTTTNGTTTNGTTTNGSTSTTANGAAVCIICDNRYSVIANGTCVKEPTNNCLSAAPITTTNGTTTTTTNGSTTNNATTIQTDNEGYTCALCARGYYDNGQNDCNSTSVQGSGVQILAALVSVFALLAFL